KQTVVAMRDYADKNGGRLPPAALRDKAGKPLLSWRVLILPSLGGQALYDEFHLDEPWDSPHNLRPPERMPVAFGDPTRYRLPPTHTRLQVFVGPGTPFEIAEGPRLKGDFPDGLDQTILIAEGAVAVPWTKPADLDYSPDEPSPPLGMPVGR